MQKVARARKWNKLLDPFCQLLKFSLIYDSNMMQAKVCVNENIPVIPIPGPSALVAALSASGLVTNEFTFGNLLMFFM